MVKMISHMLHKMKTHWSKRAGPGIGAVGKPYRGQRRRMTQHNEDSFSASFESMSIGTQYSDSSNDANVFPPYTMSYGQPSSHPSDSIGEYGLINYPHDAPMSFQTPYQMQQGFQTSMWVNPEFPIHGEVVVQVKTFMHGMFNLIINIIGTLCLRMSIVFTKMGSLRQMLQWRHIDLHFGGERP